MYLIENLFHNFNMFLPNYTTRFLWWHYRFWTTGTTFFLNTACSIVKNVLHSARSIKSHLFDITTSGCVISASAATNRNLELVKEWISNSQTFFQILHISPMSMFICLNVLGSSMICSWRISNIYFDFFNCGCQKKTITNVWNSTHSNRWATKDIRFKLTGLFCKNFVTF